MGVTKARLITLLGFRKNGKPLKSGPDRYSLDSWRNSHGTFTSFRRFSDAHAG